jgi:type VI secretion system ImpC/EvpB family protein
VLLVNREIARIDGLVNAQLNAVLHHPDFQRLEAAWRGLCYLTEQTPDDARVQVKVLNVSRKELVRDLVTNANYFDQTWLFRKVYEAEFGTPGGHPYGVLVGDYEFTNHPQDMELLKAVAGVAAAAFAPFVAAAHPSLLELESFAKLEESPDLQHPFTQLDFLGWSTFRSWEDSRFVGLTLPRVLLRRPYADDTHRPDGFRFREQVGARDRSGYLWGNAAFAFAAVLIRAFVRTGWLAGIRGTRRGGEGDGLVTGLPAVPFAADAPGAVPRGPTDAAVTDRQEKELGELGFIPLCRCHDTGLAAFYGNQSVQKPKSYDEAAATANARLSAMLQYILCVSRFAHYLKVIVRDQVGNVTSPEECQDKLNRWLREYTMAPGKGGNETRARRPLSESDVRVFERPDRPGSYYCEIKLRPHFQLDQLAASLRLGTELAPRAT